MKEMFEKGDLIWCPGDGDDDHYPGWSEDWGIIISVKAGYKENKYSVRWLYDTDTQEDYAWVHKYCQLMASAK